MTGAIEKQYGTHLFPPEQLEWYHALAHALDHLAALSTYDPAIQAVLEPERNRPVGAILTKRSVVIWYD